MRCQMFVMLILNASAKGGLLNCEFSYETFFHQPNRSAQPPIISSSSITNRMAETCLWVMTRQNIFGISLGKLVELGKMEKVEDWEFTPKEMTPSFNVHEELPEMFMRAFFLDDKVFLAGGLIDSPSIWELPTESSNFYQLLFEDDVNDNNNRNKVFKINISEAGDSIPPPPTVVSDCFIANIGGHVYLLLHDGTGKPIELGLWVLSDDRMKWKSLLDPPSLNTHECADNWSCFVLQEKLFMVVRDRQKIFMYVFDTRTLAWTKVEDDVVALWRSSVACFPRTTVSSLPDVCNCCVALTYSLDKVPGDCHVRVKIDAMLVNKQYHTVFRFQSLDDCFKAILPPSFHFFSVRVNFLELGNGVVCVLVNGDVPLSDPVLCKDGDVPESNPVLCIVIFALSLAQELDIEAPGKNQRFLSVDDVYVSQVFTLKGYEKDRTPEELQDGFIFPPPRDAGIGHLFQRSTPRSESDSASSSSQNPSRNTPKDRSPKAVGHELPTSPLPDKKRRSRTILKLKCQIAQLQKDLKIAEDQLTKEMQRRASSSYAHAPSRPSPSITYPTCDRQPPVVFSSTSCTQLTILSSRIFGSCTQPAAAIRSSRSHTQPAAAIRSSRSHTSAAQPH